MAAKPENTFIQAVHRHLPPVHQLYREKMANPYHGGTPDVWYSAKLDLWVEYKFITVPKRPDTVINLVSPKDPMLSALQQQWLADRYTEGRNVQVIVGCKEGGVVFTDTAWTRPVTAVEFRKRLLTRQQVAQHIASIVQGAHEFSNPVHNGARHASRVPDRVIGVAGNVPCPTPKRRTGFQKPTPPSARARVTLAPPVK